MNVSLCLIVCTLLAFVEIEAQAAYKSGHCPLRNTVTKCMPTCQNDYQCSFNEKCCPNKCGSTSCASSSAVSTGNDGGYKGSSRDVYCAGVKCRVGEKCQFDRRTKMDKCVRA